MYMHDNINSESLIYIDYRLCTHLVRVQQNEAMKIHMSHFISIIKLHYGLF